MTKKKAAAAADVRSVEVPELDIRTAELTLVGDTPLITHRFSEKAKREMLEKQQGKARRNKEPKDPEADYQASLYKFSSPNGAEYGFPAVAFKAAAVGACRFVDDMPMTEARGAFHVRAVADDLVPLKGTPRMREDTVRLAGRAGVTDLRYRAEFLTWSTVIDVAYNAGAITLEQIVNLFNIAGFSIGVGEKRPEQGSGDSFGMFHVK